MRLHIAVLVLLTSAWAGPDALGQGVSGSAGNAGSSPVVSPFFPTPGGDIGGDGGGGGGQGFVPGDAGVPTSDDDSSNQPSANDSTVRGQGGRNTGIRASGGNAATATSQSMARVQAAGYAVRDSWQMWWETNKFDFIELRRVSDAPLTGQGQVRETDEQRALRMAQVAQVIEQAVLPALRELTGSSDAGVRAASVVALAKLADAQCVDIARAMLTDGHRDVRKAAMLALGLLESGRARYALMSIGSDASFGRKLLERTSVNMEERGTALLAASLSDRRDSSQVLESILDDAVDSTFQLLASGCEAAGLGQAAEIIPQLSAIALDRDRPEFVRSAAVSALGRLGDPSVVPVLLEVLDQNDLEPARAAVVALGLTTHAGNSWAIDRLVAILNKGRDASARHFAAVSLGRLGGEQARVALTSALRDASTDMRPWVALGLGLCERGQPNGDAAALITARLAKEANPETAAAYLLALGLCGGPEVVELLAAEARGRQTQRAGQAAIALGLTHHPDALPVLREILGSSDSPDVQRQAALGLGILGNSAAVPDLVDLMARTSSAAVAAFAAQGIAFMGDANAVGPLLHVIDKHGSRGVATTYAAAALGQLFDEERRPVLSRLASGDNYFARSDAATGLLLLGF